ncbi:MAG: hypothetical protein BWY78_00466 [Alphaproteobacteria bacterium ADurb.Bin438]|nr:MAG: hypothetical protein BWY78_00466 [Alphaproteobacteria bacterium ADurb.Bin438]
MIESFSSPQSSNIADAEYIFESCLLTVTFVKHSRYEYFNVPESIWHGFKSASSKGKYFALHIRNNFRYSKVF